MELIENPGTYDHLVKVLLVGDSGVGKSSLLHRFSSNTFVEYCPATIGVDFATKHVTVFDQRVKLQVWDTAGQEKFHTLTKTFYRGAQGVILVYDVTEPDSLRSLEDFWLREIQTHCATLPVLLLCANKIDKGEQRRIAWAEGMEFAKMCGSLFVEVSAKSGLAVETAFEELVLKIMQHPELLGSSRADATTVDLKSEESAARGWSCAC